MGVRVSKHEWKKRGEGGQGNEKGKGCGGKNADVIEKENEDGRKITRERNEEKIADKKGTEMREAACAQRDQRMKGHKEGPQRKASG